MYATASECARVLATASSGDADACKRFALRRLEAVPEVSVFHVGGASDWDIALDYHENASSVSVTISGHVRPLPLLGITASAFGESSGGMVVLKVQVSEKVRPDWLGGSYGSWTGVWG
jgi:hypothetical protein